RAADRLGPGVVDRRLARRERAALPDQLAGWLAVVQRAVHDRLQRGAGGAEIGADRHAQAALELDAIGDLARPVAALDAADQQRIWQLQFAHQGVGDAGV